MIDALDNPEEADQYIMGGLRKLGFDPRTVKYVVITHGHGDHSGGASELQAKIPGVHILLSSGDRLEDDRGRCGERADQTRGAQTRRMEITDGQKLTLGDETVTLYLDAGSYARHGFAPDPGQGSRYAAYHRFHLAAPARMASLPEMNKAYDLSMEKLGKIARDAHAEGYISNHEAQDDGAYKLEYVR